MIPLISLALLSWRQLRTMMLSVPFLQILVRPFWQGQHLFGFQRQPRVAQVVVGHHRVVVGFLNAKYAMVLPPFGGLEKYSFLGKRRPLRHSDTPEGKTYRW